MKKLLLGTIALLALGAAANAADLGAPVYSAPVSWTGLYVGGTIGGISGNFDPTNVAAGPYFGEPANVAAVNAAGIQSLKPSSLTGSVELGYNWQFGSMVVGLEIDWAAYRLAGTPITGWTTSINSNWLFTARPRIGFAAGNWLFYATGGLAVTDLNGAFIFGDNILAAEGVPINSIRTGYAVGGGVEAALWNHWSLKAEYLYVNFGAVTASGAFLPPFDTTTFNNSADLKANIGRVGLNYRFGPAGAADLGVAYKRPVLPVALWSWSGFYLGGHIGSAMGLNNINDPLAPSIFGDLVHSPGYLAGGQIGYNWQAPGSYWVFGIEADATWANLDGTNTCYAFSGTFTSFNCRAHTNSFGTLTGRVGWAFGPSGRSLAYVKGGAAWANSNVDMIINNDVFGDVGGNTANTGITSWGWTLGAGAEYAMTAHWTVRAEYDYMDPGSKNVLAPNPSVITAPTVPLMGAFFPVPGTTVSEQIHVFKLGLNYKFGSDVAVFAGGFGWPAVAVGYPKKGPIYRGPVTAWAAGWEVEGGARYWYSSGRFQKDMAPGNIGPQNPTLNISRLTWDNLTGNSGELFARIDSPWNIFVKGFVGGGSVSGGKINDEDWGFTPPFAAVNTGYSNTLGNAFGTLGYATVDAGYDVFRGAGYKLGIFAGYNIYTENKSSTTFTQIALPQSGIGNPPLNVFVLGENDKWQSLRIGANAETMLTPQLKLVADVAFLPYVRFDGQDFHPLRPFLAEEWGNGIGTQAELFLYYYLTPQFSLGVGGRYWAAWTTNGADCREPPFGVPPFGECPAPLQNLQFKTERYGVLFQTAYRWDEPVAIARK